MTAFRWIDRHGVAHELTSPEEIEREWQQVKQELLDMRARLESANYAIFMVAYGEATSLRARMVALQANLHDFVRYEAARALAMIDQIDTEASFLRDLHRSYEQRDERREDNAALTSPPTADQTAVLRRQASRDGRNASIPATFADAHAALLAHPETCRASLPDTAPGFEWTDRHMHYHQVRDLRQIEREYIAVAGELVRMRPQMAPDAPIRDVLKALEHGRLAVERVSILERTLSRWSAHVIGVVRSDYVTFLGELEK